MSHGRESSATFSYTDGVHVKIAERYKPPRSITLPVALHQYLKSEIPSEEYDFRLERSVLEKIGEWQALRKSEAEKRLERINAHEEAWKKKINEEEQQFSSGRSGVTFESVSPEKTGSSSMSHSHHRVSSSVPSCLAYPESVSSCSNSYTSVPSTTTISNSFSKIEVQIGSSNVHSSISPLKNVPYSHRSSILTPVPFSQISSVSNSTKLSSQFNLSDFEADTSSPFDNMELKTINEMEELAHVLQPVSISPESKEISEKVDMDRNNSFPPTTLSYGIHNSAHYNTVGAKPSRDTTTLTHINGFSGYSSYSTTPRVKEREVRGEHFVNLNSTVYDPSNKPVEMSNMYGYYPPQTWSGGVNVGNLHAYPTVGSQETGTNNVSSGNGLTSEGVAFSDLEHGTGLNSPISFPPKNYQCPSQDDQQVSGRTLSKSVPDIVQELEDELAVKRVAEKNAITNRLSNTPPPRPSSFGSTGLEGWKPWPDLDSPEPTQFKQKKSPAKLPKKASVLTNPFNELSASSQQLAKHISEMGFDLARVARACKIFGDDDKKVVEFLLQVQTLEEKKWPGDLAEQALVVNKHNISEAVKYLEAFTQLLDLGFQEEKVSEALALFQNDRDKALDHLIS